MAASIETMPSLDAFEGIKTFLAHAGGTAKAALHDVNHQWELNLSLHKDTFSDGPKRKSLKGQLAACRERIRYGMGQPGYRVAWERAQKLIREVFSQKPEMLTSSEIEATPNTARQAFKNSQAIHAKIKTIMELSASS